MEALDALVANLISLQKEITVIQKTVKTLTTEAKKLKKHIKKPKGERKRNVEPSGFNKPGPITPELTKFLGEKANTEVARTTVTKFVSQYIKDKKLQNSENKKEFKVDDKLSKLFGIDKGTSLKYFGVQSHMKQHFLPRKPVEPSKP